MRCHIILVKPARGENVGFAARAVKTMGMDSLYLVGNPLQHSMEARKTGYGSHDILDQAVVCDQLESALDSMDLTIGTTSKPRIKRYDDHTPTEIFEIVNSKREILQDIGIVFGSEENGLSTSELDQCDLISTIPLTTDYPSLNLGQSVLIYAWEFQKSKLVTSKAPEDPKIQRLLKQEVKQLLSQLEYTNKPLLCRRIMDRVLLLNSDDSKLMMTVLNKIKRGRKNLD